MRIAEWEITQWESRNVRSGRNGWMHSELRVGRRRARLLTLQQAERRSREASDVDQRQQLREFGGGTLFFFLVDEMCVHASLVWYV